IIRGESGVAYTRSGAFGTDKNGYIVNNEGMKLQGFAPSETGQATGGGPLTDLRVTTGEIQPRPTSRVESVINLDAAAPPSSVIGSTLTLNSGRSVVSQMASADPRINGYESNSVEVVGPDGSVVRRVHVSENSSANATAQLLSAAPGVTARGTTVAFINNLTAGVDGTTRFMLNGREYSVDPADPDALDLLAASINASATNITARVVGTGIRIVHSTGADLNFTGSVTSQGSLSITPAQYDPQTQEYVPQAAGSENLVLDNTSVVVVGGTVEMTLEEGYSL